MLCSCKTRSTAKYLINDLPLCGRCCPVKFRKEEYAIPKNADSKQLIANSDSRYRELFEKEADLLVQKHGNSMPDIVYRNSTLGERAVLNFFYPFNERWERCRRIDPKKAIRYDCVFSHQVITLILDFSIRPSLLSRLSTKWRECFESPVINLMQREDYKKWRYYSRCLKENGLKEILSSLSYLTYVPLALEYLLDDAKNDDLVVNYIYFWYANKEVTKFIFTHRPDLTKKVYEYLHEQKSICERLKTEDRHVFEIYNNLHEYMEVFEQ